MADDSEVVSLRAERDRLAAICAALESEKACMELDVLSQWDCIQHMLMAFDDRESDPRVFMECIDVLRAVEKHGRELASQHDARIRAAALEEAAKACSRLETTLTERACEDCNGDAELDGAAATGAHRCAKAIRALASAPGKEPRERV